MRSDFFVRHHIMRPCLNELQKEYCVKIKLIALDWQWVTLMSLCQINRLGHSSPVVHNVEFKTHKLLEKLRIMLKKIQLILTILDEVLSDHLSWHPYFSKYKWFYPYTSHMSDFVLILSLLYCWLFGGSALVLGPAGEKPKNSTVKLGW